ncbi:MAG: hypothetical protein KF787_01645 [Phycisphaeraceae bacterium]|mgnify:CR=1 FL=1|nr:MarR family transcriptional regulator [Phycisphaerae bacterium]MBX3391326.1 hypothetical protein [Phycisphaeraceae bacterium]HRJ49260.1 hypothetical protein [Phycisphaerales bacterium]
MTTPRRPRSKPTGRANKGEPSAGGGPQHGRTDLRHEIGKRRPFDLPEQEAYLNIVRTASVLGVEFERLFRGYGLSESAYNAMRILRGAMTGPGAPGRKTCMEIGAQMVTPVPDVTRVIDRIERLGFAERRRFSADRRVMHVSLTRKGLDLLAAIDQPLLDLHRRQLGHMTEDELRVLSDLLSKARSSKPR